MKNDNKNMRSITKNFLKNLNESDLPTSLESGQAADIESAIQQLEKISSYFPGHEQEMHKMVFLLKTFARGSRGKGHPGLPAVEPNDQ